MLLNETFGSYHLRLCAALSCPGQGMELKPLASFFRPQWNILSRIPMHLWLTNEIEEDYRDRMKTLGNIVVPLQGELGMNVIARQCRECRTLGLLKS